MRLGDQGAVQLDEDIAGHVEHGLDMGLKQLPAVGVGGARIEIVGPVAPQLGQHLIAVGRVKAAEHQIDLQRLVEEARIRTVRLHLLFQPVDQPRPQQALQRRGDKRCPTPIAGDRTG